jgi:hypothetical protein
MNFSSFPAELRLMIYWVLLVLDADIDLRPTMPRPSRESTGKKEADSIRKPFVQSYPTAALPGYLNAQLMTARGSYRPFGHFAARIGDLSEIGSIARGENERSSRSHHVW